MILQKCAVRLGVLLLGAMVVGMFGYPRHGRAEGGGSVSHGLVTAVPLEVVAEQPAELFDLQKKTVRYIPVGEGGYKVEAEARGQAVACEKLLADADAQGAFYARGWRIPLPFSFPFAGKQWNQVYVNMNGNISFEKPESDYWPARDPWPDGGMCSMGEVIDSRSMAGMEQMIAALWGPYDGDAKVSHVRIHVDAERLAVTWNVTRVKYGQEPAGINTFQARLFASGVIEMTYPQVAEHDGIVGVFPGGAVRGERLHHWEHTGASPDPNVSIRAGDIYDVGSTLDFVFTMKDDVPAKVESGTLGYRSFVGYKGATNQVGVSIGEAGAKAFDWLGASPLTGGWRTDGKTVEVFVSKLRVAGCTEFPVGWSVDWWGKAGKFVGSGGELPVVNLRGVAAGTVKLSKGVAARGGNVFEAFHYPVVTKSSERLLERIYKQSPGEEDIALVFTDFRLDDLYGQGAGAIAANVAIKGIGSGNEHPRSTESVGSTQLQMTIGTTWIGGSLFAETGMENGRHWFHFAKGVTWICHECTHRWGMDLSFRNPETGQTEKLVTAVGHWRDELNTTAVVQMGAQYIERPVAGASIMGGAAWKENGDGTFSKSDFPYGFPGGYSGLDLYVLGMLPPEKVPATFVIEDMKDMGGNRFSGKKVRVDMKSVVEAMGLRDPASAAAQTTFRMAVYLVHEPDHEVNPELMVRAKRLGVAVEDFFNRATGGRMVATGG